MQGPERGNFGQLFIETLHALMWNIRYGYKIS
jgi:hypothetical protein